MACQQTDQSDCTPPVSACVEKVHHDHSTPVRPSPADRHSTMSTKRFLLAIFVFLVVTLGLASAANPQPWLRMRRPCFQHNAQEQLCSAGSSTETEVVDSAFTALLRSASPESLHQLLHEFFPKAFRQGVWPSEEEALKAVHRVNAALATNIARMAKRQNESNTTTTTPSTPLSGTTSTTTGTGSSAPTSSVAAQTSTQSGQRTSTSAVQSATTASNVLSTVQSGSSSTASVSTATTSASGSSATAGMLTNGSARIPVPFPSTIARSNSTSSGTTSAQATPMTERGSWLCPATTVSLCTSASYICAGLFGPADHGGPWPPTAFRTICLTDMPAGTTLTTTVTGSGTPVSSAPGSTETGGSSGVSTTSDLPQSSKLVTSVYTSTDAAGSIIIVTATTFVNADPTNATPSATSAPGSLQTNGASASIMGGLSFELLVGVAIVRLLVC